MPTYYNENDPKTAAWLRELIAQGHLPSGVVDTRSIEQVQPDDLHDYDQHHFFAGIGGWPYALHLAGVPALNCWTGSCPCQPFSIAGKGRGESDPRHLWPVWHRLITVCRPATIFGEQVASPAGREWLARVFADLEALGYAVAGTDLCAAGVSAPMVSQRLYWVATASIERRSEYERVAISMEKKEPRLSGNGKNDSRLAQANGYHRHWWSGPLQVGWNCIEGEVTRGGRKYRAQWRIKPGLSLLANGIPGRVAQLCGFGNAVVPQVTATFIQASLAATTQLT